MNLIYVIGSLVVLVIGLISAFFVFTGMKKLSPGITRKMFFWLFITIVLCGVPYALWNFLIESEVLVIPSAGNRELVGMVLVFFFFVFMLKTSMTAKKLSEEFGFE
ncbi:MAG: hypothetical protein JW703_03070 [Candidatus Diapherotrites archaeon]|nr:hypothetical protein [Candidatus Diapherotrites archaeon]